MAKKDADVSVRKAVVLADVSVDGIQYHSGDLIVIGGPVAAAYGELGSFDFSAEAVAYREAELQQTARDHAAAVAKLAAAAEAAEAAKAKAE